MPRVLFLILASLALAACAGTPPIESEGADAEITPSRAAQQFDSVKGRTVLWGGAILSGKNYEDYTELELLAYPLASDQRPQRSSRPIGRFIARFDGYLELAEYDTGRSLTVVGPVSDTREGSVGETPYTYPVVIAEQRHLWPEDRPQPRQDSNVRFHFGLGVIFR